MYNQCSTFPSMFKISIVYFSTHPHTSMHRVCSLYRFIGLSFIRVAASRMVRNGAARVHQIQHEHQNKDCKVLMCWDMNAHCSGKRGPVFRTDKLWKTCFSTMALVNSLGFHKMQGISRLAEQLLTFEIWLCSLGLVAWLVTSLDGWLDRWEGHYV